MTYRNLLVLAVLLATTAISVYLCYQLVEPFIPALTGALSLAILINPLHVLLSKRLGRPSIAAGISVAAVAMVVLVPLYFVGERLVVEIQQAGSDLGSVDWRRFPVTAWLGERWSLQEALERVLQAAQAWVGSILGGTVWTLTQVLIALFSLFFFLRDHESAVELARSLAPLSGTETDEVFTRIGAMVRAIVYGQLTIAAIQGTLGGLMFWMLGLPAPLLWGIVMGILGIVPMLGTFLIWAPAALLLFLQESWIKGAILTAWGVGVVSTIDNVLYPALVGKDIRLHTLPVFLALLGGVSVFGAAGLVIGPVILTVSISLLQIVRKRMDRPVPATADVLQAAPTR